MFGRRDELVVVRFRDRDDHDDFNESNNLNHLMPKNNAL